MKTEQKIQLFVMCCVMAISAALLVWCCMPDYSNDKYNYQSDNIDSVDNSTTPKKVPHPVILPIHNGNSSTPIIIYH